jgi:hypothetical protein
MKLGDKVLYIDRACRGRIPGTVTWVHEREAGNLLWGPGYWIGVCYPNNPAVREFYRAASVLHHFEHEFEIIGVDTDLLACDHTLDDHTIDGCQLCPCSWASRVTRIEERVHGRSMLFRRFHLSHPNSP